jgi:sulfofructose kinase
MDAMSSRSTPTSAVCVGHCTLDTIGVVDRLQPLGSKAELHQFTIQGGGSAATAGVMLAALGVPTRFIGKVGDDGRGELIRRTLSESGVDTSGVVEEAGAVSQFTFIVAEASTGQRQSWWTHGTVSPLRAEEVDVSCLEGASILVLDGAHAEAQLKLARAARAAGIPVLLDGGRVTAASEALVREATVLIASERFASEFSGAGQLQAALSRLRAAGPPVAVITLGEEGSIGADAGGVHVQAAMPLAEETDTTGAGDVYRGAFAYAWLRGDGLSGSMAFATAAATLSLRSFGGRSAIPTLEEIEPMLRGK